MMPYGIIVHRKSDNRDLEFMYADPMESMDHFVHCFESQLELDDMKLYLRPMSSMSEDEKIKLKEYLEAEEVDCNGFGYIEGGTLEDYVSRLSYSLCNDVIDWLSARHFDYRGLIEKCLALQAPDGMYKTNDII